MTSEELAKGKGVSATYLSRIQHLALLAPETVEAILDGRQPAGLQLDRLLEGFPLSWEEQGAALGILRMASRFLPLHLRS